MHRIFIVGCPRSGTTMLMNLLAERGRLHRTVETFFFVNAAGNAEYRRFSSTARLGKNHWLSLMREWAGVTTVDAWRVMNDRPERFAKVDFRQFDGGRGTIKRVASDFTEFMDRLAEAHDNNGWIEKTPSHVHYLRHLRHIPGATIIHIVREPQHVVASIMDRAKSGYPGFAERYDTVERAVDNWNTAIRDSERFVGMPGHVFVHYNDVAAAPEAMTEQLLARLGVPLSAMASAVRRDQAFQYIAPAASKWDSVLTADEQARAELLLDDIPVAIERAYLRPAPAPLNLTAHQ